MLCRVDVASSKVDGNDSAERTAKVNLFVESIALAVEKPYLSEDF